MVSSELLLMYLADARLPVAGHTQSGGLEPALRDGLGADDVPAYVRTRLRSVVRIEAGTAVVGLHCLRQGLPLEPVVWAWEARTPSAAMRATSRAMGRTLLRLTTRLWNDDPVTGALGTAPPRALVLAALASIHGLAPAALARLVGYDDVQTVASAALKLYPLDPVVVAGWVRDGLPDVDAAAAAVAGLTEPDDIPTTGSPQVEQWAEAHARASRRLFSA